MSEPIRPGAGERSPADILGSLELPDRLSGSGKGGDPSRRVLLEDYRPVWSCLERRVATAVWEEQGPRPFISGEVPFVVHNSGWTAGNAAQVLFTNCTEIDSSSAKITVLELGAGLGLFAKQLLDAFHRLCSDHERDFYQRLVYFVTDASERTQRVWRETGLFEEHADRVVLARSDGMRPLDLTGPGGEPIDPRKVRAVFCNYLLDALPTAIVRRRGNGIQQLHMRVWLDGAEWELHRDPDSPTADEAVHLARSEDAGNLARLVPLLPWLELEAAFLDGGVDELPHAEELLEFHAGASRAILNHGAIACLENCLASLEPGGFVLFSDYGAVNRAAAATVAYPGRFGGTWAMPLDFAFLERFHSSAGARVSRTEGDDERTVHSRLLTRDGSGGTAEAFLERYGDPRGAGAEQRPRRAIENINAGRLQEALRIYQEGLTYCPDDWNLLGHAAQFLNQQLLHHEEALELARRAVGINPWFSTFLWNTLGNCLFSLGQREEAHEAYIHALKINEDDAQTHLNLAYTWESRGDMERALASLARGLQRDVDGRFRTALLEKVRHLLDRMDAEAAARSERLQRRDTTLGKAD